MRKFYLLLSCLILLSPSFGHTIELVIGEKHIKPGIVFIFEGAVKDTVLDSNMNLPENETDVHLEARVNWDDKRVPEGTPKGGFVPYLWVSAKVINERTKAYHMVDLLPHINLIDNFHYARNIKLPGKDTDKYTVIFTIVAPTNKQLFIHRDWLNGYGNKLFKKTRHFKYRNVNFKKIARATR